VRKQLACGPGISLQNAASAVSFVSAGTPIPTPSQASAAFSGIRWWLRVYGPRRKLLSHANEDIYELGRIERVYWTLNW
jgi:hypothetical protein